MKAVSPDQNPTTVRRFISLNQEFHVALVGISENPVIINSYGRLGYHERIVLTQYKTGVSNSEAIVEEHAAIIQALKSGNRYLIATALRSHISRGVEAFDID
jgi:DNA-binding GntR family transcriptional regulator